MAWNSGSPSVTGKIPNKDFTLVRTVPFGRLIVFSSLSPHKQAGVLFGRLSQKLKECQCFKIALTKQMILDIFVQNQK